MNRQHRASSGSRVIQFRVMCGLGFAEQGASRRSPGSLKSCGREIRAISSSNLRKNPWRPRFLQGHDDLWVIKGGKPDVVRSVDRLHTHCRCFVPLKPNLPPFPKHIRSREILRPNLEQYLPSLSVQAISQTQNERQKQVRKNFLGPAGQLGSRSDRQPLVVLCIIWRQWR